MRNRAQFCTTVLLHIDGTTPLHSVERGQASEVIWVHHHHHSVTRHCQHTANRSVAHTVVVGPPDNRSFASCVLTSMTSIKKLKRNGVGEMTESWSFVNSLLKSLALISVFLKSVCFISSHIPNCDEMINCFFRHRFPSTVWWKTCPTTSARHAVTMRTCSTVELPP